MKTTNKKGTIQAFFGFGTFLLILITIYVLIYLANPGAGNEITGAIAHLFGAVKGGS